MDHSTAREILGVSEQASFEETKQRFRALAKLHHPDLNPGKASTNFVLVSDAYLVLQGGEVRISENKDAADYTSHMIWWQNSISQYFGDMVSSFIQGMGAIEGLLAVRPSGGETLHTAHGDQSAPAFTRRHPKWCAAP